MIDVNLRGQQDIIGLALKGLCGVAGVPRDCVRVMWCRHPSLHAEVLQLTVPDWVPAGTFAELSKTLEEVPVMFEVVHRPSGLDPGAAQAAFRLGGYKAVRAMLDSAHDYGQRLA